MKYFLIGSKIGLTMETNNTDNVMTSKEILPESERLTEKDFENAKEWGIGSSIVTYHLALEASEKRVEELENKIEFANKIIHGNVVNALNGNDYAVTISNLHVENKELREEVERLKHQFLKTR